MKSYQIKEMIIDDDSYSKEYVTTDFTHNNKEYSITFNKSDLELINAWEFQNDASVPANLSDELIELIRNDVKNKI